MPCVKYFDFHWSLCGLRILPTVTYYSYKYTSQPLMFVSHSEIILLTVTL